MNSFETLGDNRANTQKARALCSPVSRRARSVLFATENHQWCRIGLVVFRSIKDKGLRRIWLSEVTCVAAFDIAKKLIAKSDVCEGSANHNLVISSTRTV